MVAVVVCYPAVVGRKLVLQMVVVTLPFII